MKKTIFLIINIVMILTLTGCISWPETPTVQIESDVPIGISNPTIPIPDDLEFFDTIEEAIINNDLDISIYEIVERIKLFENDEYAVVFLWEKNMDGDDVVCLYKFVVNDTDGMRRYSAPIVATVRSPVAKKLFVTRGKLDEIGEVRSSIANDSLRSFRIDNTKNFFWGLSQTESAKNLKIEGQPVTEVIEVVLDGETWYFWYFEDLKTDKNPYFKDLRKYTEGEFIITMD